MPQEIKNKILAGAETLFLRYGFKSITMDDIARELGISKKTLYQFFEDKGDLVKQTVTRHLEQEENLCKQMTVKVTNPVEFMLRITESFSEVKKQLNTSVLFDLKKYFRDTWDLLNRFRLNFIYNQVLTNLREGKERGYYHEDLNESLTARFYIQLVDFMINPDNYGDEPVDFKEVHQEMMRYHLRSICTDKGLRVLRKSNLYANPS